MSRNVLSLSTLSTAILTAILCNGAQAQTPTPPQVSATATAPATDVSRADRKFVAKAASGGMAEVELGNLAQQKGTSDQVKQFGAHMVQDHTKANDALKQIAMSKGIEVPAAVDKSDQKTMDKLQKLSGAEFDKAYMKDMVSDHKDDISDFKKEARSGKDSDIKSFASQTLPTLQEHLKMAEAANKSL